MKKNFKEKLCMCLMTAMMLSFFILPITSTEVMLASDIQVVDMNKAGKDNDKDDDDDGNANDAVIEKFETFETLFTDIISTLGTIYTLWGISEWGLAWHESNGTMGGQSFKRIFGGLVVVLAPQILQILT